MPEPRTDLLTPGSTAAWAAAGAATALVKSRIPGLLRTALEDLHPDLRRVAHYHFGWTDSAGKPTGTGGEGKLLRSRLTLLCALAAGGAPEQALAGAVAVELVHNYSLLHDDIIDTDEQRRDRPTAWVVFGAPAALLAGDALTALAVQQLARTDQTRSGPLPMLLGALAGVANGQAADLALERLSAAHVAFTHYADASQKTTALLGACAAIGALLGGADQQLVTTLHRAAADLGMAWQIANDVEDIWGDPAVTGKKTRNDLRAAKKTLPIIAALRSRTPEGRQLAVLLDQHSPLDDHNLQAAADLVAAAGGRTYAEQLSGQYLCSATETLTTAIRPCPVRDELVRLFSHIVTRQPSPAPPTGGPPH
ncbi:dimethylallyltranstransferase [Streptomyces sp. CB01201]|uniref:polyprenyl synthetase family protein n=1 Tax=Streptomyces sp. CB01201 TaxID=2020324 RepID=UPI000C27FADB|nr:polyprenyl synthetase family protein [Streptomyces sp. CB01201]PJM97978.1 dimethylallyltranstransferase [Streptomyces sp. CB01201]